MIEFDKALWEERARSRHKKALRRGSKDRSAVDSQLERDLRSTVKLARVTEWCASKSLTVVFGKKPGGQYDTLSRTITIACRAAPERQLFYLLHECGHHLIGFKEHDERFGLGYPKTEDPDWNGTFDHRFACLEEEIEAWHRGWRLARRLRLRIPRADFDRVRLECLRSYVQWVNGRTLLRNV